MRIGIQCGKNRIFLGYLLPLLILTNSAIVSGQTTTANERPEAFRFLDNLAEELKNIEEFFDFLNDFLAANPPTGAGYKSNSPSTLLAPTGPIIVDSLPDLCDEAIHDFRQSLKLDFIKVAGAADGTISRNQFETMVQSGLFPLKSEPVPVYFERHDADRNQRLDINEFVPSVQEIAREQAMQPLTKAYTEGQTYPTGQAPTTTPASKPQPSPTEPPPNHSIYATVSQIEQRIREFAANEGLEIIRTADGKLQPVDAQGGIVPIPSGVIPPARLEAEAMMVNFAKTTGGTTKRNPEGVLQVIDKNGQVIPLQELPVPMRPPYLPPAS